MSERPPLPGHWDPEYAAERDWLEPWLSEQGPYAFWDSVRLLKTVPLPIYLSDPTDLVPPSDEFNDVRVLTRRRAARTSKGLMDLWWWTATDGRGRWIAGKARRIR